MTAQHQTYNGPTDPTATSTAGSAGNPVLGLGSGAARHVVGEDRDTSGGIVATATNPMGSPKAGALSPNDRVMVDGMPTTVKVAERMGHIVHIGHGRYADAGTTTSGLERPTAKPQASDEWTVGGEPAENRGPELMAANHQDMEGMAAEMMFQDIRSGVGGITYTATVRELVNTGTLAPHSLGHLASELKVTPEQAAQMVEKVSQGLERQWTREVRNSLGDDLMEDFAQWANHPARSDKMKAAMLAQVNARSLSGYRGMVKDFLIDLPEINPGAIAGADLGQGLSVYQDRRTGTVMVRHPGGETPWKNAVKTGLIRLTKGR